MAPGKKDISRQDAHEKEIIGIRVIKNIAEKAFSGMIPGAQILNAIKEIIIFYRLLPDDWKVKAKKIFKKLWDREQVTLSTDTEKAKSIFEVDFEDERIKELYDLLPPADRSALRLGKLIDDYNRKGLHSEVGDVRTEILEKYGERGLNISHLISSGDIQDLLEDVGSSSEEVKKEIFYQWSEQYNTFALFLSPTELENESEIKKKLKNMIKNTPKDYILIHMIGSTEDIDNLNALFNRFFSVDFKCEGQQSTISELGFCKNIKIKIHFRPR